MDHYPHELLDAIEANPKRRDVAKLIAEVKRLTAIALAAEQLLNNESPMLHDGLKSELRYRLKTERSQWPLYPTQLA